MCGSSQSVFISSWFHLLSGEFWSLLSPSLFLSVLKKVDGVDKMEQNEQKNQQYSWKTWWTKEKKEKSYNATSDFSVTKMVLVVCGTCAIYEPLWLGSSRDHRKGAEGVSFNSYLFPRSWLDEKKPGFFSDGSVTSQSVTIISIRGLLVDLNQILQSYIIKIM